MVCDVSRLDWCKVSDGCIYTSVRSQLDAKNGGRRSNIHDALIAEVAIANGFTLLTADADLAEIAREHGGAVCRVSV
jgi:predicted nucleic acid-binding protein